MNWAAGATALAVLLTEAATAAPADASATGYVVALQGHWTLQGHGAALVVGSAVPLPAQVIVRTPLAGDRVVIVAARSGAVVAERTCAGAADCRLPLPVPAPRAAEAGAAASPWMAGLARVMARLEAAPDRYVSTLSRHDAALQDVALVLIDGALDLAPALSSLPAGRYEVMLASTACDARHPCPALAHLVDWQPGRPASWPATIAPGVHELRVRPAGRGAAPWWNARALLLRPADADARLARLHDWSLATRGWGAAVDADARRSVLRAVMDELAAQP